MGRHGRSHRFLDHWHQRELALLSGEVLHWTLIDDPRHKAPHVECARITAVDGHTRVLHRTEVLRLLVEHDHPDAEYVPVETHVGQPFMH